MVNLFSDPRSTRRCIEQVYGLFMGRKENLMIILPAWPANAFVCVSFGFAPFLTIVLSGARRY